MTTTSLSTTPSLKSSALFSELESVLTEDPDLVKSVKGTFSFQITEKSKQVGKFVLHILTLRLRYAI